jgi:hypothetical protein
MWFTLDNLVRCCHTVSDQEINRAKVQLKANLLMNVDSFSGTAEDIGRQMITYGRRMTNAEASLQKKLFHFFVMIIICRLNDVTIVE